MRHFTHRSVNNTPFNVLSLSAYLQAGKPLVLNVVKKAEAALLQDTTLNKVCFCVFF